MLVKVDVASLYSGLLACGEKRNVWIPQFFPTLKDYISSAEFTQDTLVRDIPSMNCLMFIVTAYLLLRWETIGNKRREKGECHLAAVSKGLNSTHYFLVILKHFSPTFSQYLFPASLLNSLFCPSPIFSSLWLCWWMQAEKRNVACSSWSTEDSFHSKSF